MDMQWKEIPQDWRWDGNPNFINTELRVRMARHDLRQDKVAAILGLKRQALARRLKGETPWRHSELAKLANFWHTDVSDLTGIKSPANGTRTANHP